MRDSTIKSSSMDDFKSFADHDDPFGGLEFTRISIHSKVSVFRTIRNSLTKNSSLWLMEDGQSLF